MDYHVASTGSDSREPVFADTAIVVTHDVDFAQLVADQMAILHRGAFIETGRPAEIMASSHPDVRRFLAGELREEPR